MPQKAAAGHLVVRRHFEVGEQAADVDDDFIRGPVLGHAAVHGDDVVRAALVNARDDAARARGAERGLHLVAVVVRVFHAEDRLHMREAPEQLHAEAVFPFELFRVSQVLQLAAAALSAVRAAPGFVLRGHGGPPIASVFSVPILPSAARESKKNAAAARKARRAAFGPAAVVFSRSGGGAGEFSA